MFPKQSDDVAYGTYTNTQTMVYSAAIFKANPSWNSADMIGAISGAAAGSYYWVGFAKNTPLADAKTALNNSVLYYALATATDTKITDANLISDLEALLGASLYEGTCDIEATATSPNLPGILDLSYWTWFKGEKGQSGASGSGAWGTITGDIQSQTDLQNEFSTKADISSLATVATSGSYTDLSDKLVYPLLTATYDSINNRFSATTGDSLSTIPDGTKFAIKFASSAGASWDHTIAIDSAVVGILTKSATNLEPASTHAMTSVDPTIVYEFTKQTYASNPMLIATNVYEKIGTSDLGAAAVTDAKVDWSSIDTLFYKTGDVIDESYNGNIATPVLPGFLTSGNKDLVVNIPVAKRLDNISSATINIVTGWARCQGAYLTNMGSENDLVTQSTSVSVVLSKVTGSLGVKFTRSGGWGATNNSTVAIALTRLKITFA
jgi:hypothetical protein